ncbi:MAG: hypothetical protein IPM36_24305 [Lewinellaceae bacterium]|nr:hypothetical protein [Lewinellaceae bacterium]
MSNPIAQYTYIPWYRRGLSNQIQATSDERGTISAEVYYKTNQASSHQLGAAKTLALLGPGDVESINPQAIIKVEPRNGLTDFEANYLACIEFYDEDFPWRYTPEPASDHLMPWLFLMALKTDEFTFEPIDSAKPVQAIKITAQEPLNIPPGDAWAWAHVQVNKRLNADVQNQGALRTELAALLEIDPDAAFSRLVCPRKLELNTRYHMFLVPLYESGRRAGLNQDTTGAGMSKSWAVGDSDRVFPFYYHWEFATSAEGDFETLARRLQAMSADELDAPTMNIQSLIEELLPDDNPTPQPTEVLPFIAAYKAPGQTIPAWPSGANQTDQDLKIALRDRINSTDTNPTCDPIVNNPPMYGRWHAAVNILQPTPPAGKSWLYALNLDPKYRAVAGLGTEIIRKNQEKFMDIAWDQLGEVLEANQKLRQAQLAIEVNKKILSKHIESRDAEDIVATTRLVHNRVKATPTGTSTVAREVASKALTASGTNAGLRKALRRNGKSAKKLNRLIGANMRIDNAQFINRLNAKVISGAPDKPNPYTFATDGSPVSVNAGTTVASATYVSTEETAWLDTLNQYAGQIPAAAQTGATLFTTVKDAILTQLQPIKTLGERMMRLIPVPNIPAYSGSTVSRIKPVMAAPKFVESMYEHLAALSKDFIIPGISGLKNNSVLLMEPNQPFIEAFMAGLNHEMARELLWREYPTDQRGTYFKQFWNPDDFLNLTGATVNLEDIRPMHDWAQNLGSNKPADSMAPGLVLVIRGDLLRKFPNTIIYAHKAKFNPHPVRELDADDVVNFKFPVFKAQLEPDITLIGFELTPAQARGTQSDAGYFFMFKEPLGEARFGLDLLEPDPDTGQYVFPAINSWNDLAWQHLDQTAPESVHHVDLNATLGSGPVNAPDNTVIYGSSGNAAHMAYILYQMPVLLGMHASDLLPPAPPDQGNNTFSTQYQSIV